MYIWTSLLLAFAISNLPTTSYSLERESFDLYFESLNCSINESNLLTSTLNCFVSKNTKRRTFTIEFQFTEDVDDWNLNMLVVLPRKQSDFVLLNMTKIDGCQLLGNKNQVTFIKIGRGLLDRYSNVPHSCPFRKNVFYYIRGFRMDMKSIPAFNLETDMNIWFEMSTKRNPIFKGYLQSRIMLRRNNKKKGI